MAEHGWVLFWKGLGMQCCLYTQEGKTLLQTQEWGWWQRKITGFAWTPRAVSAEKRAEQRVQGSSLLFAWHVHMAATGCLLIVREDMKAPTTDALLVISVFGENDIVARDAVLLQ